jgi:hypothetical protein
MVEELSIFNPSHFNALPDIEIADAQMREDNTLSVALTARCPVFLKHNMCDKSGSPLLHNQWPIEPGEVPVQHAEKTNGPRHFEMRPRQQTESIWPTILAVSEGSEARLEPIEPAKVLLTNFMSSSYSVDQ